MQTSAERIKSYDVAILAMETELTYLCREPSKNVKHIDTVRKVIATLQSLRKRVTL